LIQRAGNDILNVREFYPARSGKEALLESVMIEEGAVCNYFVQLKLHEKAIHRPSLACHRSSEDTGGEEGGGYGNGIHWGSIAGGRDGFSVSENGREGQQGER
jgi:hypothetical protein